MPKSGSFMDYLQKPKKITDRLKEEELAARLENL